MKMIRLVMIGKKSKRQLVLAVFEDIKETKAEVIAENFTKTFLSLLKEGTEIITEEITIEEKHGK